MHNGNIQKNCQYAGKTIPYPLACTQTRLKNVKIKRKLIGKNVNIRVNIRKNEKTADSRRNFTNKTAEFPTTLLLTVRFLRTVLGNKTGSTEQKMFPIARISRFRIFIFFGNPYPTGYNSCPRI